MLGKKRAAEETSAQDTERATKVSKTTKVSGGKAAAKNGAKAAAAKVCRPYINLTSRITIPRFFQPKFTPDEFKAKALPLHVMLTHTPPSIIKEGLIEEDGTEEKSPPVADSTTSDIGLVGSLTLVPSAFSTGSYGWKGSKRVTVELQAGEVGPDGTREKVQVILSYVFFES